jgi:hypothetical protein
VDTIASCQRLKVVPARATASGTPRCGSEYRDSTSPPRYPSLPQPSRRRTQHTRFTSRGLRGSQYTIPQPLWYTSTKCFGRITSTFPCTLLYTGLHRGQRYGTGGDMTEQGRCPPSPTEKGQCTRALILVGSVRPNQVYFTTGFPPDCILWSTQSK